MHSYYENEKEMRNLHKIIADKSKHTEAKQKALNKMGDASVRPRLLTKAEQKEKTKNWPKSKGKMSSSEKMKFLGE